MTIPQYLDLIQKRFESGISREHSYRADLEMLIRALAPDVTVTNEPANVTDCGNPDYVITKGKIPVGYIEAKDIGKDLNSKSYKEQFGRYRKALDNLIITDYVWFQFFQNGDLVTEIRIADLENNRIIPRPDQFEIFENQIKDFVTFVGQTVKSAAKLAQMMAGKARLLQNTLENAVTSDEETEANTSLRGQLNSFKQILIHDITPKAFADLYAQTLAYGMFAARLHDPTLEDFTRQEAADLIPKSNPFLRKLFQYIAGYDIDPRIKTTVENLALVFRAADVKAILNNFGKSTEQNDPIIHFYETFLAEYDPKLRKQRGVWYTPEPVVHFIVRATDDILKTEFGIKNGLADTSKTKIKVKAMTKKTADRRSKMREVEVEKEVHKIQILDPATGTGTFLAEVVKFIYNKRFKAMQGIWSSYVENDLVPRLNGFELLMASYAMAHLKLDMLLAETGYKPTKDQRFNIFLTNSLEPGIKEVPNLFMAQWLTEESAKANEIKQEKPVMVVLGNPPYSGESANKGDWIMNLMDDYKKEPGGKEKLNERNPKWINDDYVKFMRYGQYFIEKNGEGILAYINPHGFLDNPTFRGMRWHLLKTYDKIFTIDLHGNSKKKEVSPDGSPDVNVFDIQQGVSINVFVKTGKKKPDDLAKVFHFDLYGNRDFKYEFLRKNDLKSVPFSKLPNVPPMYFMVEKDFELEGEYKKGFSCNDLFLINGVGMTTAHDDFVIKENRDDLLNFYKEFQNSDRDAELLHRKFNVRKKNGWDILAGYDNIKNEKDLSKYIQPLAYRPFDNRFIFYEDKLVWRTVRKVMTHFLKGENVGLVIGRQGQVVGSMPWNLSFVTKMITDFNMFYRGGGMIFPLYIYPSSPENEMFAATPRVPNLNKKIIEKLSAVLGLRFVPEKDLSNFENLTNLPPTNLTFAPIDVLDYIYAVLHSPTYREKFKEFLKIDFPRVPYPKDAPTFRKLVALGGELRRFHLMEHTDSEQFITEYSVAGDNVVTRKMSKNSPGFQSYKDLTNFENLSNLSHLGRVWINDEQYFDKVPESAWNFYIGGYQPAQKWLKDRRGRELGFEDIIHYQKIITALAATERVMREIEDLGLGV